MARRAQAERQRQGILGPAPEPTPPSLFDPGSPAAAMADARQAASQPMTGQGAAPAQGQSQRRGQGNSGDMIRQAAGFISAEISEVAGDVPRGAEDWIQSAATDTIESSPGRDGRPFLARLFAGPKVPGLSDAQNARLLKNALVSTGLSIMGAPAGVPWPQALAMGILGARQQATSTAGELLDEKQRQQRILSRYQTLSNTDMSELERMKELRRRMLSEGDTDGAKAVSDVVERLRDESTEKDELTFQTIQGIPLFVNERTGEAFDLEGEKITELPASPQQSEGSFREEVMRDGEPHTVLFNARGEEIRDLGPTEAPRDAATEGSFREEVMRDGELHTVLFDKHGEEIRDLGPAEAAGGGGGGEATPATIATMERELDTLESIFSERDFEPFGVAGSAAAESGLTRGATSPKLQQARASANNVLSLIIRQRSGAQATEAEVERLASFAVPQPGDDPETVRTKLERLRSIVSDFKAGGGSTSSAGSGDGAGVEETLDVLEGGF